MIENKLTRCVRNRKKAGLSLKDCFQVPCVLCPVENCEAERGSNENKSDIQVLG